MNYENRVKIVTSTRLNEKSHLEMKNKTQHCIGVYRFHAFHGIKFDTTMPNERIGIIPLTCLDVTTNYEQLLTSGLLDKAFEPIGSALN